MKFSFRIFLFAFLISSGLYATGIWQKTANNQGILTFQKTKSNGILEVKGLVILDKGIDVAGNIFRMIDLHPRWVGYCDKAEIVEIINPNHFIVYETLKPPWPVTKRDLVIESTAEYHNNELFVTIASKAGESPLRPVTPDYIRIRTMNVKVYIEYISPNQTGISYELLVNPGGDVPEFLVNLFNQIYIYQNMINLKKISNDEIYNKNHIEHADTKLLKKLLADEDVIRNTLADRLSRFIDSRENIALLINDRDFLNQWMNKKSGLAENLYWGNHGQDLAEDALSKIMETYLKRFSYTHSNIKKLCAHRTVRSIFKSGNLKDTLTPQLMEKILSGKDNQYSR